MRAEFQVILLVLTVAVIFVNGWTDAPNAILTVVSAGTLEYGKAVRLAAVCNLAGILVMSMVSPSVAETTVSLAGFGGQSPNRTAAALCASLLTVVLFAAAAWAFGIPTSESHALIAALSGSSLALGGAAGTDASAWGKVLWGLGLSVGMGLLAGFVLTKALSPPLKRLPGALLGRLQILTAGGTAFMHGAQDGQKFIAVLVIVDLLARGAHEMGPVNLSDHKLALALTAVVMALGTAVGGRRIVEKLGGGLAPLRKYQCVCADLGGVLCLLTASLTGIPMSTTHAKTSAIFGAGLSGGGRAGAGIMREIAAAWIVTFPACGLMGFLFARGFLLFT